MFRTRSPILALAALAAALCVGTPAQAQSLEQMAGQMIVVGFSGDGVDDKSVVALRAEIAAQTLGGVMYLKTNVASLKAVAAMNAAFRAASPSLPPFLTLDQEGGAVERLTSAVGFREVPSAESVASSNDPAGARSIYEGMAKGIADLGFTVNFGPVLDLKSNPKNEVIAKYGRAFGPGADRVAIYAEEFIKAHHDAGILTAVKHFPGHGSSTADSHEGYVDITETWKDAELDPYRTLLEANDLDFVMIGHLINRDISAEPASLSKEWITDQLRGKLGFTGVVISDDLEMGAIRKHYDLKETVLRAVRAGTDVLLFSNTAKPSPTLADDIRTILVAEAERDPAFRARIEESYGRIVGLKQRIGAAPDAAAMAALPDGDIPPIPADPSATISEIRAKIQ